MKPANLLHIESLDSDWCDNDEIMLHACFRLLCDCIEEENLLDGHIDWEHDEEHRKVKKELSLLYQWWQERKTIRFVTNAQDKEQYLIDNEKLVKLVTLRHYLWT